MSKNYTKAEVSQLPARMVEIIGEISAESLSIQRSVAISKIKANVEIDGFRKGAAPESMIVQKVGEMSILEEAAELALNLAYPEILEDKKIEAIGRPEITITKIAPGQALEFKIRTAITPEVSLGEYKKIAAILNAKNANDNKEDVTEKEIDDVVLNLRKDVAHVKYHQEHTDEHDHAHGEFSDDDLPGVNEEFLKMLGGPAGGASNGFASVEDLRAKIRESLVHEKNMKAKDKRRTEVLDEIIADSKIELPELIINAELDKMIAQFKDDVARAGATYDGYLEHIKKTEEDIRKEWRDTAEKRAKSMIVLSRIATAESIEPQEEAIKSEMEKILAQDAKLERFRVRMFVENFLSNELVFNFLEKVQK